MKICHPNFVITRSLRKQGIRVTRLPGWYKKIGRPGCPLRGLPGHDNDGNEVLPSRTALAESGVAGVGHPHCYLRG